LLALPLTPPTPNPLPQKLKRVTPTPTPPSTPTPTPTPTPTQTPTPTPTLTPAAAVPPSPSAFPAPPPPPLPPLARHALLVTGALARKIAAERLAGVLDAFSSEGGVDVFGAFGVEPYSDLDSYVSAGRRDASGGTAPVTRDEVDQYLNESLAVLRLHPRVAAFEVAEMSASLEGLRAHPRLAALVPGFPYASQSGRFVGYVAGAVRLLYNFYNLLRAHELMLAHAAARNSSYEFVARSRPDVDFLGAKVDLDSFAAAVRGGASGASSVRAAAVRGGASGASSVRAAAAAVAARCAASLSLPALRPAEFPLFPGGGLEDASLDALGAGAAEPAFLFIPEQQANGGVTDHVGWGPAASFAHLAATVLHIDAIMREGGYFHAETLTLRGPAYSVREANRAAAAEGQTALVLFRAALKYCVKLDNCAGRH